MSHIRAESGKNQQKWRSAEGVGVTVNLSKIATDCKNKGRRVFSAELHLTDGAASY